MNLEFIGQNIHFAANLLISLALFSVFWLIFDAWTQRKRWVEAVKWCGFLLLAIGFLLNAAVIDAADLTNSLLSGILPNLAFGLRCAGYVLLIVGQLADPIMKRPVYKDEFAQPSEAPSKASAVASSSTAGSGTVVKAIMAPLLPLLVAGLYWRRATTGLEKHLLPLAFGFITLATFELLAAFGEWHNTTNPLIYNLVAAYGPLWWLSKAALLVASIIFGRWVWRYLTKRLSSQIFIVLVTTTVAMYFASTVGFSYLLLGNTRTQALADITTASKVLNYAVSSNKAELQAQADAVVARPGLVGAVQADSHEATLSALGSYAVANKLASIIVSDADGKVLARSDDQDRWGDSISDNPLVQRSLIGREAASVTTVDGVLAPTVLLVSSRPIRSADNLIVGTVTISKAVSSAFVDGIKNSTGLDSTVYAGNQRSATTLKTADNQTRAIGIKETDQQVLTTVLKQGKTYTGEATFQNRIYLAAYSPLKDANNTTVGMLLVARPASTLLAAAGRSIELAFLTAVSLLILSVLPVYAIARKIAGGVR